MSGQRLSAEQRRLRARLAGLSSWAHTPDRSARAQRAHDARRARIAKELDPDDTMAPDQRAAAVDARIKADMTRLAFKASKARRARRTSGAEAPSQ